MMKTLTIRPRAALLIGAAFVATPAFAQDASQTITPPPIMVTPAPAPAAPAPQRVIEMQPQAPIVQAVPDVPKPQTPPSYARREAAPASPARQARIARSQPAAAPHAAPAPAPAAETVPAQPEAAAAPPPAPAAQQPAPAAQQPAASAPAATTTATTEQTGTRGVAWPWLLGGIALAIAAIAFLLTRRRRPDLVEDRAPAARAAPEPAEPAVEPRPVPVAVTAAAVAPIPEPEVREAQTASVAEDVSVHDPDQTDLAGVADAVAPVARRPWLELGMRPIRAGTSKDEAVVDIELTVGNSGDMVARDVRISTFMLADGEGGEMERLLAEHRDDAHVPPVTIEPGEGTRVDAHLAAPKDDLGRSFNPVVVAEARYTLPDGRQGRTAAAFRVGVASEDGIRPLVATRPHLTETVGAELVGEAKHA